MLTKKKREHTDFARNKKIKEGALPDRLFLLTKSGPLDSLIAGKKPASKPPETETEIELTDNNKDEDSSSQFSRLSLENHPQNSQEDSNSIPCVCETSNHFCVRCGHRVCNFCSIPASEFEELRRIHRDKGDCFGGKLHDRENNKVKLKGE